METKTIGMIVYFS